LIELLANDVSHTQKQIYVQTEKGLSLIPDSVLV